MKLLTFFAIRSGNFFRLMSLSAFALLLTSSALFAQEEAAERDTRPIRNTFESIWLIDNQTVMVPIKGTFQMDINHRFGTIKNGYDDFYGLYASSNIRIGFDYVPIDRLMIGFGFTKLNKYWDFNARYALFRQGRQGGWPVSVTYYVNMALDTRSQNAFPEDTYEGIDRLSYFHQLMIARKFSKAFSLQASLSLSHYNFQEQIPVDDSEPPVTEKMRNDHLAIAVLGRLKVSNTMSIIANWDQPLTNHPINNPEPNISFGIEVVSSSHAFQIFLGNYYSIIPQHNNMFNQNRPDMFSNYLIGFNMTRLWNF